MRRARHKAQRDVREHSSSEEILRKRFSLVSLHRDRINKSSLGNKKSSLCAFHTQTRVS
jgi:hypothetical protein